MPDKKIIGARLRRFRGKKSLRAVARDLSVSPMAVSLWERGLRMPKDDVKIRIATYYRRSVASIFYKE